MTPSEVRTMSDSAIVELLVSLEPTNEAITWLAAVISDPVKVAGVSELALRYRTGSSGAAMPKGEKGRHPSATSIRINPDAFKAFFFRRRIPLSEVGPLFGRCSGWASVIAHKARIGYWAADELATELGIHVDDFLAQICVPEELSRLSA